MNLLLIYYTVSVRVGIVCGLSWLLRFSKMWLFLECVIWVLKWQKKKKLKAEVFINLNCGPFYVIGDLVSASNFL